MSTKKNSFPKALFMASSIAAFLVFGAFYFILVFGFAHPEENNIKVSDSRVNSDKYFLNEDYRDIDPYVTKVPKLKDMLAGPIISANDPSMGAEAQEVTIVEFSDFECVFCGQQEKILAEVVDKYKSEVKLIWKDYPKSDPESISFKAAVAARCAQQQDMFWPYHDFLYENAANLSEDLFLKTANSLNLDLQLFEKCLDQEEVERLVLENIEEANALDIYGIPFVYVNDQQIMGEISFEDLERIVNIEMKKK